MSSTLPDDITPPPVIAPPIFGAPDPAVRFPAADEFPVSNDASGEPASPARAESYLPWLVSLVVNLGLLLLFAFWSLAAILPSQRELFTMSVDWSDPEEDQVAVDFNVSQLSPAAAPSAPTFAALDDAPLLPPLAAISQPSDELLATLTSGEGPQTQTAGLSVSRSAGERFGAASSLPQSYDLNIIVPTSLAKGPITEKELSEVRSVEAVAARVGDEIRDKLLEDDLMVLWLLDASISLVDDRLVLADHMDQFYDNLQAQMKAESNKHLLMNGAIAFGDGARLLTAPYRVPKKATLAMRTMPIDPSGQETVCSAIAWAVSAAREDWSKRRGKLMVVVLTDESGDDTLLLEETIELCRYHQASVTVIGPSSVLGTDEGFHRWVHPQIGQAFWLPVVKGPDTAVPARLRLPYWWSTELVRNANLLPPGAADLPQNDERLTPWAAQLPAWAKGAEVNPSDYFVGSFRGRELINLNSGFPPYALMRLTRETGGRYTMFDRAGDRGPFRLALMRPYLPDYRSLPEILTEITQQPLPLAITNASMITRKYAPQTPPQTHFTSRAGTDPEVFRNRCYRDYFPAADAQADRTAILLEELLGLFGANGMEELYSQQSPRDKAWYDLNVGRLLLQSARFAEYRVMLRLLGEPANFPPQANELTLFPVDTVRAGELSEARAREGIRLLNRCLETNPGTPWAFLAARELAHPIALDFNWRYNPPPPPSPPRPYVPPGRPAAPIILPKL